MKRAVSLLALLGGLAGASPSEGAEYKVAQGDTLYGIAKKVGVPLEVLRHQNPAIEPTKLQVGQKITYDSLPRQTLNTVRDFPLQTKPSPNYSVGRKKPLEGIVIHSTEGSGASAARWLTNPQSKASAHYLIMENGAVIQMVDDTNTAWHAGRNANATHIGIEYAGYAHKPGHAFTAEQYTNGALLIAHLMRQHNIPRTKVVSHAYVTEHLGGTTHTDPGVNFDWQAFNAQLGTATNATVRLRRQK